jgi:hypothetical protein
MTSLHYELSGLTDAPDAPVIVLSDSLGTPSRCGRRKWTRSASRFESCGTTRAAMVVPRCRRPLTRSTISDATCSHCSIRIEAAAAFNEAVLRFLGE